MVNGWISMRRTESGWPMLQPPQHPLEGTRWQVTAIFDTELGADTRSYRGPT
jgi:hypothetical protein